MITNQFLLWSLVYSHCGQVVETSKIKAVNGKSGKGKMMRKGEFSAIGATFINNFRSPLADWSPPKDYIGLKQPEAYAKMLKDNMTVMELFQKVIATEKIVKSYYKGAISKDPETCGFWDPTFLVDIAADANPQSTTTGNNHDGPSEVYIDGVRTSHLSNLHGALPEVLSREKFNCKKKSCEYRWYWIVFRGHQKAKPHFQMWVQCAMILGNKKDPIEVEPTGIFLADRRKSGGSKFPSVPNKVGLPVFANTSEKKRGGGNSANVGNYADVGNY
jgi:hypothetical protein